MFSAPILRTFLVFVTIIACSIVSDAQSKKLSGVVKDKQSDEPIPFASVLLRMAHRGVLTDSAGRFSIEYDPSMLHDSLSVQSVGYKTLVLPVSALRDFAEISFKIEVLPPSGEAIVKTKYNRALWFWKRIMAHKDRNNRTHWDSYSYEIYNKLEMDLNNVRKEKLAKNIILKPLNFVLSYVDSSKDEKPYLPVYLSETLSDYYYQKNPERIHEVIKAARTNGVESESLIKEMGGMYQNVNVYNNFIPVFNKDFISPFNNNADNYYHFKLADTAYLGGRRLVHFRFSAKRKGESTFEGDAWVNDTSFAIQKITLRPSPDANINFIEGLSIIQEYRLINDSIWFLYKDRFVADIAPIANGRLGIKGRKTATYQHVVLNDSLAIKDIAATAKIQQVDIKPGINNLSDSFWISNRHEPLDKNERTVYKVLDTLTQNKTYIFYRDAMEAFLKGTLDVGNLRIGPWYYWMSGNRWEGSRFRFDLSTNRGFHKKLFLSGYAAYGTRDQAIKGGGEIKYLFDKDNWTFLRLSYKNDLDNGQVNYDQLGTDNIFGTIFRRPGIPFKFQKLQKEELEFYKESPRGFGAGIAFTGKRFEALQNLPGKELYTSLGDDPFNTFEAMLHFRYSHLERFLVTNFSRISLGTYYPVLDLKYTKGFSGFLNGHYDYHKIDFTVSHNFPISPFGTLYYNLFAGKVWGILPYQMLDILPGNEMYYYNKYAFNLMQRFEYLTDQYAGFNVEHNFGPGLFKYIPVTRKLKFRQFWSAKGIVGSLSTANQQLNFTGNYPYRSLDGKPYIELGTGVDNILKFFRVDFVWRVAAPQPLNGTLRDKFGMFASFRFQF